MQYIEGRTMFNDCIIMAGGSGTRLWPASSRSLPKQFLPMGGSGKSFFNAAVDRALAVIDRYREGRVIVVCGKSHVSHVVRALENYPDGDKRHLVVIPEPAAKNTAPAIACAVTFSDWMRGEERKILVQTSDHIIGPPDAFTINAAAAEAFAQADRLAIFGIAPRGPDTGYGYIEAGTALSAKGEKPEVYKVKSFREKPNLATAEAFVKAGTFFWNAGMFAFSSKFILNEFKTLAPQVIAPFGKLRAPDDRSFKTERGIRILWEWLELPDAYQAAEGISFDYAIAEKCSRTVMVKASFDWTDVGSWDEYARLAAPRKAEVYETGSSNCFVDSDLPVALIGVDDLIVAVRSGRGGSPGSVLVAKRGETQKVREIVELIKKSGRLDLL